MSPGDNDLVSHWVSKALDHRSARPVLMGIIIIALLAAAVSFMQRIVPRHYELRVSGGDEASERHELLSVLAEYTREENLELLIHPTAGSLEALQELEAGHLDLALVQGGIASMEENVVHVTTLGSEILHVVVRPGIESFEDLRGKSINIGPQQGGTAVVAREILRLSDLTDADYVPMRHRASQLHDVSDAEMPDAIFHIGSIPSKVVEYLVRERGYHLMSVPFNTALEMRHQWMAPSTIPAYVYSVKRGVPRESMPAIGVESHLVGNPSANPHAVDRLLRVLYGEKMAAHWPRELDDSRVTDSSGFELSVGSQLYLRRNDPWLTWSKIEECQNWIGLVMSLGTASFMLWSRVFRKRPAP